MKVLFFLVLAVVVNIFYFPVSAEEDLHIKILLHEPILVEMVEGETMELMFTGKIIFPGENKENVLCLCENKNQGYYAELTPQTKVFISGKLITKNLKEKLKSLNGTKASMYGLYQERIIYIDSERRAYKDYWKEISIAPLNSK